LSSGQYRQMEGFKLVEGERSAKNGRKGDERISIRQVMNKVIKRKIPFNCSSENEEEHEEFHSKKRHDLKILTEKFKATISRREKCELTRIIHSPSEMKKKLLNKLFQEHCQEVQKELSRLRFHPGRHELDVKNQIQQLESHSKTLDQMDYEQLPEFILDSIKDLIQEDVSMVKEGNDGIDGNGDGNNEVNRCKGGDGNNVDDDDDVVEVAVPPKPPAPVVTISDAEEEIRTENDTQTQSSAINGEETRASHCSQMDKLYMINEEEESLHEELRQLKMRENDLLDRLQYLHSLRKGILQDSLH